MHARSTAGFILDPLEDQLPVRTYKAACPVLLCDHEIIMVVVVLASDAIKNVEVLEYPELGMEAIWKIDVENFPAFIVVDDKGNDFFEEFMG